MIIALVVLFGMAVIVGGVGRLLGARIPPAALQRLKLGPVDSGLGVAVAVFATLLAAWLAASLLAGSQFRASLRPWTSLGSCEPWTGCFPPCPPFSPEWSRCSSPRTSLLSLPASLPSWPRPSRPPAIPPWGRPSWTPNRPRCRSWATGAGSSRRAPDSSLRPGTSSPMRTWWRGSPIHSSSTPVVATRPRPCCSTLSSTSRSSKFPGSPIRPSTSTPTSSAAGLRVSCSDSPKEDPFTTARPQSTPPSRRPGSTSTGDADRREVYEQGRGSARKLRWPGCRLG